MRTCNGADADRLIQDEVARQFIEEVVRQTKKAGLVSAEPADAAAGRGGGRSGATGREAVDMI
jgi:hypothetical protein